jgi:DNA-directed RNA polymerase subunit E'/Rpb7
MVVLLFEPLSGEIKMGTLGGLLLGTVAVTFTVRVFGLVVAVSPFAVSIPVSSIPA